MAGFTGKEIEHKLESYGAKTDFIHVKKDYLESMLR